VPVVATTCSLTEDLSVKSVQTLDLQASSIGTRAMEDDGNACIVRPNDSGMRIQEDFVSLAEKGSRCLNQPTTNETGLGFCARFGRKNLRTLSQETSCTIGLCCHHHDVRDHQIQEWWAVLQVTNRTKSSEFCNAPSWTITSSPTG